MTATITATTEELRAERFYGHVCQVGKGCPEPPVMGLDITCPNGHERIGTICNKHRRGSLSCRICLERDHVKVPLFLVEPEYAQQGVL